LVIEYLNWRFIWNLVLETYDFSHKTTRRPHLYLTWSRGSRFYAKLKYHLGTESFEKCFPPLAGFEFKSKIPDFEREKTKVLIHPDEKSIGTGIHTQSILRIYPTKFGGGLNSECDPRG
jgi:hypothetical protein